MPVKPCACEFGHKYFESEAEDLGFKCPKDGTKITGPVGTDAVAPKKLASPRPRAKAKKPKKA